MEPASKRKRRRGPYGQKEFIENEGPSFEPEVILLDMSFFIIMYFRELTARRGYNMLICTIELSI